MPLALADNVETQQKVNGDDLSNWELAEDPATSCWLPATQTVPLTPGLREPNSSSWAACFWELGYFYFDMDFPRLHAMLRWLHEELWECTTNFVLEHKLIEMADPLCYVAWSQEARKLKSTHWDKIDERELTDWTFLIGHTQVPDSAFLDGFTTHWGSANSVTELLRSADEVRHAAAHHRPISVRDLFQAMLLPRVLKDMKRADRIEHVFYAISDEAGSFFDETTRMDAEQTIYILPCGTARQKLARLESLLQTLCFSYAQRKTPNVLSGCCWVVPDRVEISKLSDWRFKTLYQDDFPNKRFDDENFHQTVVALQHLRNQLWHRHPVSNTDFLYFFHVAVRFAIYTANRAGSINVEIEVEMMFTGQSREDVLARLHRVYQAEELPAEEGDRRRECRRRVAIGKVLEEAGIEMSSRETFTNWNYMFQYPRPEEPYWEVTYAEPSSGALKDPGDDTPWLMEDVVPAAADLEETYPDDTYWEEGHLDTVSTHRAEIRQKDSVLAKIKYSETGYPETDDPEAEYIETEYPETDIAETDDPGTEYIETEYPETDTAETDEPGTDEPGTDEPGTEYIETEYPETDTAETEYPKTESTETAIRETQAQTSDQHPLKGLQITVTNIDQTSPPPDSLPIQSNQTLNSTPTSSIHSPLPDTPAAISQHISTTVTEDEVDLLVTHDVLDLSGGTESPSMESCQRSRLLTFSPSMHECLRW